jgi:hypothetical protein
MGIRASKKPKMNPVFKRVLASTPPMPIPMAAAKLLRPREKLTKSKPERENTEVGSFQHLSHCYITKARKGQLIRKNNVHVG